MRGLKAMIVAFVAGASFVLAQGVPRSGGWDTYAGDAQGRRYSPLTQINAKNVSTLKLAWQYGVADAGAGAVSAAGRSQAIPIVVGGVLAACRTGRAIARRLRESSPGPLMDVCSPSMPRLEH